MKVLLSRAHGVQSWFAWQRTTARLSQLIHFDPGFESTATDELAAAHADRRHVFTFSGIADLPWGLRVSAFSKVLSGPPFRAQLFGLDLNGDGTINDLLPGTGWNALGRGLDAEALRESVERFNTGVAGGRTPAGQPIPPVTLPADFTFGDSVFSQDLRVAKIFRFSDRYELSVFGEVFNLLNAANLDGYGVNLLEPTAFGQPNRRATQVFGSGGPRAFQVGARLSF